MEAAVEGPEPVWVMVCEEHQSAKASAEFLLFLLSQN